MAGKRGTLPSISDLMGQSKKRKNAITSIQACAVLRSFDIGQCDIGELNQADKTSWVVAKHGLSTVIQSMKLIQAIPPTLVGHRNEIIASDCEISTEEVSSFVHLLDESGDTDTACSNILLLPVQKCVHYDRTLVTNHVTTSVKYYSLSGARFAKITLRCKSCGITYNYTQFGDKRGVGFQFYPVRQEYIEASDTVFISRC